MSSLLSSTANCVKAYSGHGERQLWQKFRDSLQLALIIEEEK